MISIKIRSKHGDSLRDEVDNIVEAYMTKFSLLMGEEVYVLSYDMATHIYNNGTTGYQTLRKSLLSFDYIAGPVLLELGFGVKHWTLLFVSLLDQTVTYIAPFGANR